MHSERFYILFDLNYNFMFLDAENMDVYPRDLQFDYSSNTSILIHYRRKRFYVNEKKTSKLSIKGREGFDETILHLIRKKERERDKERQTDRQRQTETDREADIGERDRERERETERQTLEREEEKGILCRELTLIYSTTAHCSNLASLRCHFFIFRVLSEPVDINELNTCFDSNASSGVLLFLCLSHFVHTHPLYHCGPQL